MDNSEKKFRAIDLFSGIGGWSLGLRMAGIEVINSYEWWNKANSTNFKNNQHNATEIDIRQLKLEDLPKDIDIVVGSPPCTQFSFANRGGSGDIADGLKDIAKFLSVVDYIRPKFWAMENIPRVANIIENELREGGKLQQFAHLKPTIKTVDMSCWGLPQRRKRCIVGNFDFALLNDYKEKTVSRTLGDVIESLSKAIVNDPIYAVDLSRDKLIDHVAEEFLSPEEKRMNREMKAYHPVYNDMSFPDPLDRTARTITATCTRVSRESVVIASPESKGRFRRLTVRERGCIQGFPITYQFFGDSYAQKLKMIGNAVPPLFTFYVAQSMLGIEPKSLITPSKGIEVFLPSEDISPKTKPDSVGKSYQSTRKFRAAIPNLRFKSGVRFEFVNSFDQNFPDWKVRFYYGNSKNIMEFPLNESLLKQLKRVKSLQSIHQSVLLSISRAEQVITSTDANTLQDVWTRSKDDKIHPYDVVDIIGQATEDVINILMECENMSEQIVKDILSENSITVGADKIIKHSNAALAGFLVGSSVNSLFDKTSFNKNTSN
jgi:DNA (cytosine-5)-methyltransferase 1